MYGRWLGVPVILVDGLKGFFPALIASQAIDARAGVLAGAAAMLGHWRPLFMRWRKGGKMVATCGGAFFGVAPLVAALALGVWIVTFLALRYASVASIVAAIALPIIAALLAEPWEVVVFAAGAGTAVIVLHRTNIKRLRAGEESRFSLRRARTA